MITDKKTSDILVIENLKKIITQQKEANHRILEGWKRTLDEWGKSIKISIVVWLIAYISGIFMGLFLQRWLG